MRVIRPSPKPPPRTLTRKLLESPTPCRYFATCTTPPSSCEVFSCSFARRVLPGSSFPSSLTNSLKTLLGWALSSVSGSLGWFQVPSAQNTMFLLMLSSPKRGRYLLSALGQPSSGVTHRGQEID